MKKTFPFLLCLFLFSCDGGLQPPPPTEPGIAGTLYFAKGSWPPADSLQNLWLFASQDYPLDSAKVFEGIFNYPFRIFLHPSLTESLPFFIDSWRYSFKLPPATYPYVGVLQQVRPDYSIRSFRVVGFLKDPSDSTKPRTVTVKNDEIVTDLNIISDFRNPPPQPF